MMSMGTGIAITKDLASSHRFEYSHHIGVKVRWQVKRLRMDISRGSRGERKGIRMSGIVTTDGTRGDLEVVGVEGRSVMTVARVKNERLHLLKFLAT